MIAQICLTAFSIMAIWLIGSRPRWHFWGCICGLASEPFWLWESIASRQYGVVVLTIVYTVGWARAAARNYRKPPPLQTIDNKQLANVAAQFIQSIVTPRTYKIQATTDHRKPPKTANVSMGPTEGYSPSEVAPRTNNIRGWTGKFNGDVVNGEGGHHGSR